MTKAEWLEKHGFNTDGVTYCIYGEDTYAIKDWLKEQGAKYNPILKWHIPNKIELSEDFTLIPISFDEIYGWDEECEEACFFEKSKQIIDKKFAEAAGPSLSEYVGEIGERLRNLTVVYHSTRGFNGNYGYTYIHTFYHGENQLIWITQKLLDIDYYSVVDLTGTVKSHQIFRGVKQTQLNRCIIKRISHN